MRLIQTRVSQMEQMPDGKEKKVAKTYLVDAMTFTEAETRVAEEIGTTDCKSMGFVNFDEYVDLSGEFYFKAITYLIAVDEVTAKEKRTRFLTLVKGQNVAEVSRTLEMHKNPGDEIASIHKLDIAEVIKGEQFFKE